MRILHTVQSYWPSIGGMQEVVRQLSERMVQAGHEVTVVTGRHPLRNSKENNGVSVVDFEISGNLVTGMTGEVERYRKFVLDGDFDVVVNFAAQQWATDALLTHLEQITAAKLFVPTGFSALYDPRYRDYFESMKNWLRHYDMNIFLSDDYRDIKFAREHGIEKMIVIPNGADEREFLQVADLDIRKKLVIPSRDLLILLVGLHTGIKGHAEAIEVFRKTRMRHVTLLIVAPEEGSGCERDCKLMELWGRLNPLWKFVSKRLLVKSLSRSETVAAYQTADLMLFPSQVECSPLVLFEAMASKTPFLATDVGNATEIVRWSAGGVILPTQKDAKGFSHLQAKAASKVLTRMCQDRTQRIAMAEAGYAAWQKHFTWELIANRYLKVYQDAVNSYATVL